VLLHVCSAGQIPAGLPQANGEVVAQRLELAQAEQARASGGRHVHGYSPAWERADQRVGELALEPGDLSAQRPSRSTVLALGDEREPERQALRAIVDHHH